MYGHRRASAHKMFTGEHIRTYCACTYIGMRARRRNLRSTLRSRPALLFRLVVDLWRLQASTERYLKLRHERFDGRRSEWDCTMTIQRRHFCALSKLVHSNEEIHTICNDLLLIFAKHRDHIIN